jgi:hypothetical protein
MASLPPLSVTVTAKRRACVLDTELALSRFGLLLASRLCEEFNLWLVPELWHILDNMEVYPEVPGIQTANAPSGRGAGWRQWELSRLEKDLAGLNIFWIGDEKCESLLPKGVDPNLVHRFRRLDESLQRRPPAKKKKEHHQLPEYEFFGECFRQTVSLTAALAQHRGFILAQQGAPVEGERETEPAICGSLKVLGIKCFMLRGKKRTRMEREYLVSILDRAGISELLWAGLQLAVVHLVAPNALIIPEFREEEQNLAPELPPLSEEKRAGYPNWWEGAVSFWYPLRFD